MATQHSVRGTPAGAATARGKARDLPSPAPSPQELEERLRFEELLSGLSAAFVSPPTNEVDAQINGWLKRLAEFLAVDRIALAELTPDGSALLLTHFYANPGISRPPERVDGLTWYLSQLRQGKLLVFERLPHDLPAEATVERENIAQQGLKSHLGVPLKLGGRVFGLLAIGSIREPRHWPSALVDRLQIVGQVFASAIARRRTEQELGDRLRFEELLSGLSASFVSLPPAEVDAEITGWLKRLVELLGVERATLAGITPDGETVYTTHYYAVPGVPPPVMRASNIPWYTRQIAQGKAVVLERLPDDLPPEAAGERAIVSSQGLKSQLSVPLRIGGRVLGVLGIAALHRPRTWPPMIVDRLRILGQVFGSAIARKQADEALRASEERLRELTETTHVIPWEADARTWRFTYVGPQAERMLGYPIDRWYEDDFWAAHIHPDDRDFAVRLCAQSAERLDHYEFEYRMLAADGAPVWLHDLVSVVRENGQPVLLRGFMLDITARKQTEQALRHLSARLICAQEDERGRIARELHDDLNQRLALLSIGLEQLRQKPPASSARAREQLEELLSRAREISSDVQRISHRLHPSKLEHLGLVAALRGLCTELSEPRRVEIGFRHNQVPRPLPGDVALCLYRVAQEALHNVVKHSRARSAQVELIAGPRSLRLTVTDSGVGFVPNSASGNDGLGLVSMRERLRLLGGELAIHSRPGNGTRVEARLPLPGS